MRSNVLFVTAISMLIYSSLSIAQDRFANVEISSQHIDGSVHMLKGAGGNIGVSAGEDGILIIDDQFAPLAEKIAIAIGDIAKAPMKYVVNTHFHGDHTGSNAYFSEVQGSTIFAHDNVRQRLVAKKEHTHRELPVVTYQEGVTFHFNNDTIRVIHLPAGHTDSDSIVWFEKANVLHPGDLFFNGHFPFIDLAGGGSVAGYIANAKKVIALLNKDTQIIPGHGELASKKEYQDALNMMIETAAIVLKMKNSGMSQEQAVAQGLGEKYQAWSWDFIPEARWIKTLYKGQ